MIYELGGYLQKVKKDNITCTCMWSTIHPNAYKNGEKVCQHIQRIMIWKNGTKQKKD